MIKEFAYDQTVWGKAPKNSQGKKKKETDWRKKEDLHQKRLWEKYEKTLGGII